ncbi:MAG: hypothetical protein C4297_09475 [Gemmataceae bacterium]
MRTVYFSTAALACLAWGMTSVGCSSVEHRSEPSVKAFGGGQASATSPSGGRRQPKPMTCVRAGECFEQAADGAPADSSARRERYDLACKAYSQALELDPRCVPAHLGLARVYDKQGQYDQALQHYRRALQLQEHSASIWYDLGMCYARQKDWDQAIECLQKATALDPHNRRYAQHLGFVYARAGRDEESLQVFRRLLPEAEAWYQLALMKNHLGQPDQCERYLLLALRAEPQYVPAQKMLQALREQGQPMHPASENPRAPLPAP